MKTITKQQLYLVIGAMALLLNCNTLWNQYAVDDPLVITHNKFVAEGIRGIPKILTSDLFAGYDKQMSNEYAGGRYRPISMITFAVERNFFGLNALVSHGINVLLFTAIALLLFSLLSVHVFPQIPVLFSFLITTLFVAHPIHTEVIANIKSRDELLAFLFLLISARKLFYHQWIGSACFFLLALYSRESAMSFLLLLPLAHLFICKFNKNTLKLSVLYFSIALLMYIAMRLWVAPHRSQPSANLLNNAYAGVDLLPQLATKTYILIKEVGLLFWPAHLSWDYGFNAIPIIGLNSPKCYSAILLILLVSYFTLRGFPKKSPFTFGVLFYMLSNALFSNFIIDIGIPMAERLLFIPSLGFCMALAYLFYTAINHNALWIKRSTTFLFILIILGYSIKTIARNAEWKNDNTLNAADIKVVPESERVNFGMSNYCLKSAFAASDTLTKIAYLHKAIHYSAHCLLLFNPNPPASNNLDQALLALISWSKSPVDFLNNLKQDTLLYKLSQSPPVYAAGLLNKIGNAALEEKNYPKATAACTWAVALNPDDIESWYNLGGLALRNNDTLSNRICWETVIKLNPHHRLNKNEFYE